jgi:hypothetical protein
MEGSQYIARVLTATTLQKEGLALEKWGYGQARGACEGTSICLLDELARFSGRTTRASTGTVANCEGTSAANDRDGYR